MVIRGEHSRLLSRATTNEMAQRHAQCTVGEAKGQGHAPLLHLNGLAEAIGTFLGS